MKFSKFKNYFNLQKGKITFKIMIKRFSERFFRDAKFRIKVVIPFMTLCKTPIN